MESHSVYTEHWASPWWRCKFSSNLRTISPWFPPVEMKLIPKPVWELTQGNSQRVMVHGASMLSYFKTFITVMIVMLLKGQTSGSIGQRRVQNSAMFMPTMTLDRWKDRPLDMVWAESHKQHRRGGDSMDQTTVKLQEKNVLVIWT